MASAASISEYLTNIRELLRLDPHKFGLMVERQVQRRLLPRLHGTRANLEPELWALLVFCLDGAEAAAPPLTDETLESAKGAAQAGTSLTGEDQAAFPRAAHAVLETLDTVREAGVYPPPKGPPAAKAAPQ